MRQWLAPLLLATAAAAAPPAARLHDYSLCKTLHGATECFRIDRDCPDGVLRTYRDRKARCAGAGPESCPAIAGVIERRLQELRKLKDRDRVRNRLSASCDGFLLAGPKDLFSACIGVHRKGAASLQGLFRFVSARCGPEARR